MTRGIAQMSDISDSPKYQAIASNPNILSRPLRAVVNEKDVGQHFRKRVNIPPREYATFLRD